MYAEQFKIRPSQIGKIMTKPRTKSPLSVTAQNYCQEWLIEQRFARRKEFSSKYTDHGTKQEHLAIDMVSKDLNIPMVKNTTRFNNSWISGEPDVDCWEFGLDTKCSWDVFTFPYFTDKLKTEYDWQNHGYLDLRPCADYWVTAFTLQDHTGDDLDYQARQISRAAGAPELLFEHMELAKKRWTFDDVPLRDRIRYFVTHRDGNKIQEIHSKVEACREYIKTLEVKFASSN